MIPHSAPDDEIHVHLCTSLPDDVRAEAAALMSAQERDRYERFTLSRVRESYVVARALVRTTLSRYARISPADWAFTAGPQGKPEVVGVPGLRFNLSHTAGLLACAVTATDDLGVDVEDRQRHSDVEAVARRFFADREVAALAALPAVERRQRFFDIWTLKESFIKARGLGLPVPLSRFAFAVAGGNVDVRFEADLGERAGEWQWALAHPGERHVLSVGLHVGDHPPRRVRFFSAVPLVEVRPLELPLAARSTDRRASSDSARTA